MDIDEFLDKELDIENKDETEKTLVNETAQEEKEEETDEQDSIKRYFELWKKLFELKFKWDNNLYTEICKERNNIRQKIGKLLATVGREKRTIKRLIGKALSEMENGNFESATRVYSEIIEIRNHFPDFLLEEKKELNKEIFMLYEKLHDQIDSKFIEDSRDTITKIRGLISDASSNIEEGDIEKAKNYYEKALESYKNLPQAFLSENMRLGDDLLTIYKDLSIQHQIKDLQNQLSKKTSIDSSSSSLRLRHLSEAIKSRPRPSYQTRAIPSYESTQQQSLLNRLIVRKLERAEKNLQKELYVEAKREIDAVLKVDPDNIPARKILNRIPL